MDKEIIDYTRMIGGDKAVRLLTLANNVKQVEQEIRNEKRFNDFIKAKAHGKRKFKR